MPFLPFQILGIWFRGLLAVILLGTGIYLLKLWYDEPNRVAEVVRPEVVVGEAPDPDRPKVVRVEKRVTRWHVAFDRSTAYLASGVALCLLSLGGGSFGFPLLRKKGGAAAGAKPTSQGTEHRIKRPDGSELFAAVYGPAGAPILVMTHGWSVDSTEWDYARDQLAKSHRLILWDLPGLGRSSRPTNNDYSLENLAHDLEAVIGLANGEPVILLGHSIGGMINLTYCRVCSQDLGTRVAGLIQVHTTYTNPVHTTKNSKLYEALQNPVFVPLCHLMIWLAPLFWLMNWMSYLNGSMHRSTDKSSFSGNETREQLSKAAWYGVKAWPGVVARGMLAMFRYDATRTLDTIPVPSLMIAGDRDELTMPEASMVMVESIPKATSHTLKPARHMGHMEHHAEFAETVSQFVTACRGAAVVDVMA